MVKLAHIKPTDKVIDLGSGDGRLVIEASKHSNNVKGVEINPLLGLISNLRILFTGKRHRAKVIIGSYKSISLKEYNIIFCYLLPNSMDFLEAKFKKELKPGTKIITNTFTLKQRKPHHSSGKIYVYIVETPKEK